ncbi:MAG: hypothetical protein H6713_38205 [Myxococcales bacterium]|nr:hypothetical protein [Myxococcales bacterium]
MLSTARPPHALWSSTSLLLTAALGLAAAGCNYEPHHDYSASDSTNGSEVTGDLPTTGAETTDDTTHEDETTSGVEEPAPAVEWPHLECDPLVPSYCAFPFPNNVFTVAADTPTGRQVALPAGVIPTASGGAHPEPDVWSQSDGFSGSLPAMTHMPGAVLHDAIPGPTSIEKSMLDSSPTVLLDAETGERVPHYTELDASHTDPSKRALMIRPAVQLRESARYIVAIRDIRGQDGQPLAPTPEFKALRDLEPTSEELEQRRPLYADIFQRLEDAGVARDDLQLAWDYTVASRENVTGRLVHIRDDALAQVGQAGPAYQIKSIEYDTHEEIAARVLVDMTVPLYLDKPEAGGRFVLGPDGLPIQQGTAEYEVLVLIPYAAYEGHLSPSLAYGHGLLGSKDQTQSGTFRRFANDFHYVLIGVDWIGMSEDDLGNIAGMLVGGQIDNWDTVADRGQQGILNFMLATRMLKGAFASDENIFYEGAARPDLHKALPAIDTENAYYFGNSQGGIFGGTLMAVYTDVTRGLLGVPGQPYSLLLHRSTDFTPYFVTLKQTFPDPIDLLMVLSLMQALWDRSEPGGYTAYMREGSALPNTPGHEVFLQVAMNDHQVSPFGAHVMARSIGAVNIAPVNRPVYGLEEAPSGYAGSGMIEWDYGLPDEPKTNTPPLEGPDPHGWPRSEPESQLALDKFLREGVLESFCDGPCAAPPH